MRLSADRHDRDAAGLVHVYPVLSRRSGGLSLGINLNPNNACNWRCVYCQVPGLVRGKAPPVELDRLAGELRQMLRSIVEGDFLARHAAEGAGALQDVAFSGNGEPTSSPQFHEAVEVVLEVLGEFHLLGKTRLLVITNGSLVHRSHVEQGLRELSRARGEAWFKLDSATEEGMHRINGAAGGLDRVRTNLALCAGLLPTWIQTCVFAWKGAPPSEAERQALVEFLGEQVQAGVPLRGVLLYGLARPSYQPEAPELASLPREWLEGFAQELRTSGLEVLVFP